MFRILREPVAILYQDTQFLGSEHPKTLPPPPPHAFARRIFFFLSPFPLTRTFVSRDRVRRVKIMNLPFSVAVRETHILTELLLPWNIYSHLETYSTFEISMGRKRVLKYNFCVCVKTHSRRVSKLDLTFLRRLGYAPLMAATMTHRLLPPIVDRRIPDNQVTFTRNLFAG